MGSNLICANNVESYFTPKFIFHYLIKNKTLPDGKDQVSSKVAVTSVREIEQQ